MEYTVETAMEKVRQVLEEAEMYRHAVSVLNFDKETICPPEGLEEQGEVEAYLENRMFRLLKQEDFIEAGEFLYQNEEELGEFDKVLARRLHRSHLQTKDISPEMQHRHALVMQKAFADWLNAKQQSDFSLFAPSLQAVTEVQKEQIALRGDALDDAYDTLLSDYERGVLRKDLDACFARCRERLLPLLDRIRNSRKKIRTDFLSRNVPEAAQAQMARYLLELIGFDFSRGAFTTTEHPFTDGLGRNDIRVTTHYLEDRFASNMYSIIHEGGHALFEQLQPQENYDHFIEGEKTMGQHESVSRFYENIIGRSEAFVHLIYPKVCELFPDAMSDVSERELYEAMNVVEPSLIRTEADEFTYTLHIMIRYEIEKMILDGTVTTEQLPEIWNTKYEEYLGIRPENDREGILQDVHWSFGFGYFPTYALGNMYNAMYYQEMCKEIPVDKAVREGDFSLINGWMKEHVFAKADRMDPKQWIREITGRDFTPDDFLDYLEDKYTKLYEL